MNVSVKAIRATAVRAPEPSAPEEKRALLPGRARGGEEDLHAPHVRSRQEKALATELGARGIHYYLPLARGIRYCNRRETTVDAPPSPDYPFLWGSLDDAHGLDRTRRVANLVRVTDRDSMEWDLQNIHRALAVESCAQMHRPVLQVELLGGAVGLEIDGSLLEPKF
ncbi:MAG: hypothetical protein ACYS99_20185 [Planctomycetota bacterium]|jgi:hypothetical protein